MNRQEQYRPLRERTLESFQLRHLARRFDFGSESRVARVLVGEINARLDEMEARMGLRRVRPFELYVKRGGRDLMLPLFRPEYLNPLLAGGTFADARELVMAECGERLRQAFPRAGRRELLALIDPWALVRRNGPKRYVDRLGTEFAPPEENGEVRELRAMISRLQPCKPTRRAHALDLMMPRSLRSSLVRFVTREAGLGPVVAHKLVEEVVSLRNIVCPRKGILRSGEMPILATHVRASPSEETRTRFRRLAPVILTVWAPGEQTKEPPPTEPYLKALQRRIVRVCFEAYRQDGLLTQMDLQWIFQISSARVSELIRSFQKEHGIIVPTPGTVLDAGRSMTHKDIVVHLHLAGYSVMEIAKRTYHSPRAVDNYIGTFEAVLILYLFDVPLHLMARVLGRGHNLIREHLNLVQETFGDGETVRAYLQGKGVKVPTVVC